MNPMLIANQFCTSTSSTESTFTNVADLVPVLVDQYRNIWWSTDTNFPSFDQTFSSYQQKEFEHKIDRETTNLINAAKSNSDSRFIIVDFQQKARKTIASLASDMFHLDAEYFDFIETTGMYAAATNFFRMAREFDPNIPFEDIYQASRNVITANLIQLLLGLPVQVTPSLFAYSMLYPYTDNYLDDSSIPMAEKRSFNIRFRHRLMGESVKPANNHERVIDTLIQMIETEWDRIEFPSVYQSLLAIHSAQAKSLELVSPTFSPYEKDILGITFEKGGTSVLADGFLAAGSLSNNQAYALFGFGAFTQLMDDMEDIGTDLKEHRASLFSISAPYWKLDTLCNRFFNFGRGVISDLNMFSGNSVPEVTRLITKCLDPMLLSSIGNSLPFFSKPYASDLESHLPFRFQTITRQREKIKKQKAKLLSLMEVNI
jgi:hypothetical protein